MSRAVPRSVVLFLVLVTALAISPPSLAADPLQPGDYMEANTAEGRAACTLGFVYNGLGAYAGRVYIGTAAHCVRRVGDTVWDEAGAAFGRVAFIGNARSTALDYAFIEVLPTHASRVRAAVKGFAGAPTGVTGAGETRVGDNIRISGYGIGYDLLPTTREQRFGVLTRDTTTLYEMVGLDTFGDSGGPLVHKPTGKAFGVVSRVCLGLCTSMGPTVQGVIANAWGRGFHVRLRTIYG